MCLSHYGGKKSTVRIIRARDLIGDREMRHRVVVARSRTVASLFITRCFFCPRSECEGAQGDRARGDVVRGSSSARSINHRAKLFRKTPRAGGTRATASRHPVVFNFANKTYTYEKKNTLPRFAVCTRRCPYGKYRL